jgi:hypothetical protein
MLITVSADGSVLADPLARVSEQANMFPRAVMQTTDIIRQFCQHSINEYPQAAL